MASLFDLLMNKGKNIKENVSNLYNKITNNDVQVPKIEAVVQSVEQPENPIANLAYQNRITPLNGAERFFGRTMTKVRQKQGLLSWSGTMFEYLMPLLVMKNYRKTLLDETYDFCT